MSIDPFAPATSPEEIVAAEAAEAKRERAASKPAPKPKAAPEPAGDDPFGNPAPSGNYPAFKQLVGRHLVIRPTKLELQVPGVNPGDKPRDRITADILVCNGDPIAHKLDKYGAVVADLDPPVTPGTVIEGLYISGGKIVKELTPAVKRNGVVIGKLIQLPPQKAGNDKAYSLEEVPAGAARTAAAVMWKAFLDREAEAGVSDPFGG